MADPQITPGYTHRRTVPGAPPSIVAATRKGQRSVEELVDGYRVESAAMRDLLVDYLHDRQAALDYTSLAALASKLVLLFWRDLELHEPGIDSLRLSDAIARRWKERLKIVVHGKHRVGQRREDPNAILIAVRSFYANINHWATEDPARCAHWAAPNPINGRDLIGQNKQKHRAHSRMQQRTRESWHRCCQHWSPPPTTNAVTPANGGRGRPGLIWADDASGPAAEPHLRRGQDVLGLGVD